MLYTDPSGHFGMASLGKSMAVRASLTGMNWGLHAVNALSIFDAWQKGEWDGLTLGQVAAAIGYEIGMRKVGRLFSALSDVPVCNFVPGKNSFVAGTLVDTANGPVPIEDVRIGDTVRSFNDVTWEFSYQKVLHLIRHDEEVVVEITLASGEVIRTTPEHPFYVNGQWLDAGKLTTAHALTDRHGMTVTIRAVKSVTQKVPVMVYNLSVERDETFFVGAAGVLVHNKSKSGCGARDGFDQRKFKRELGVKAYPNDLLPQAHHVVPLGQMWGNATYAVLVSKLKKIGFNPGDPKHNGVWLPSRDGKSKGFDACVHRGPHSDSYLKHVNNSLLVALDSPDASLDDVLNEISELVNKMQSGNLAIGKECHH